MRFSPIIQKIIHDLAMVDLGWKYKNKNDKWTYVGENKDKIPEYAKDTAVKTREKSTTKKSGKPSINKDYDKIKGGFNIPSIPKGSGVELLKSLVPKPTIIRFSKKCPSMIDLIADQTKYIRDKFGSELPLPFGRGFLRV